MGILALVRPRAEARWRGAHCNCDAIARRRCILCVGDINDNGDRRVVTLLDDGLGNVLFPCCLNATSGAGGSDGEAVAGGDIGLFVDGVITGRAAALGFDSDAEFLRE